MNAASGCFRAKRRISTLTLVWVFLPVQSFPQDSATQPDRPHTAYFRNCTPAESGAQECINLEGFWTPRLAELGELALPDRLDPDIVSLYRLSDYGFVSAIPLKTVRVIVHRDGSIDTIAARKWNDGRIEKARKHFAAEKTKTIVALLKWELFYSMVGTPPPVPTSSLVGRQKPHKEYFDGGWYLLEGIQPASYHVVRRQTIRELDPDDGSWEMLSGLDHLLRALNVWAP